jgi:hypothetical protein
MRTEDEITRVHDMLAGIVLGEAPWPMDNPSERDALAAVAACMCWVLKHDETYHESAAQKFTEWLRLIESELIKKGYKLDAKPKNQN